MVQYSQYGYAAGTDPLLKNIGQGNQAETPAQEREIGPARGKVIPVAGEPGSPVGHCVSPGARPVRSVPIKAPGGA